MILLFLTLFFSFTACSQPEAIKEINSPRRAEPVTPLDTGEPDLGPFVKRIKIGQDFIFPDDETYTTARLPYFPRAYIRNKFKGKLVIFPNELKEQEPLKLPFYRIGIKDEIYVFIWKNEDLSIKVIVGDDGRVSLPLVGDVDVAGLQVPEVEARLTKRYAKYIADPQVTVTVTQPNSQRFFVTGAVRINPYITEGLISGFPLPADRRLMSALSQIEILQDADLSESYIIRGNTIIPVDLRSLIREGDISQNVLLKPSDTIVIPGPIKQITVLGEVNNPSRYQMERRTTVLDALAVSGGIKPDTAALNLAYVARGEKILPVNFDLLINQGDLSQNVLLENNDIVYIPNSKDNKVVVLGEVKKPGVIRFVDPMDILEAISKAGGFLTDTGLRDQVVVVRGGLRDPKIYSINALKMMKGGSLERFTLARYDVVYVPRKAISNWNSFVNQLLPSIQAIRDGVETYYLLRDLGR